MSVYAIGDVHGCHQAFLRLLDAISYSPPRDKLWFVGDVVNRGEESLAMLRWLHAHDDEISLVLGNHDLHLLAVAADAAKTHKDDTIDDILAAPDGKTLCDWLRRQPLAHYANGWLMIHAGALPMWDLPQLLSLAEEAHAVISGDEWWDFVPQMYGNEPACWDDALIGADRLRVIINALTRLRICTPEGKMKMNFVGAPDTAPDGYQPWFDAPQRRMQEVPIVFGHWSTLGNVERKNIHAIDSGCLWGGTLTALRLDDKKVFEVEGVKRT